MPNRSKNRTIDITNKKGDELDIYLKQLIDSYKKKAKNEFQDELIELVKDLNSRLKNFRSEIHALQEQISDVKNKNHKYEALIHDIQKIAHIGNWEWIRSTNVVNCSDEILSIYGIKRPHKPISYEKFLSYIYPYDQETVDSIIKKAVTEQQPFKAHLRIESEDEKHKFLELRGEVEVDDEDRLVRVYGTIQDISELKETKEKLFLLNQKLETKINERTRDLKRAYRNIEKEMLLKEKALEKERLLYDIVESSNDAILSKSSQGIITSWNKSATKIFGYTEKEIIGQHYFILIPDHLQEESNLIFEKIIKGEKLGAIRSIRKCKDGSLIPVSITYSTVKNNAGEVIGVSSISRDISEQIKQEQQIKSSEERYSKLVESMNEGVLIVDNNDIITFANKYMCDMLGYELDELLGKTANTLLLDDAGRERMKRIIENRKKGLSNKYEMEVLTKHNQKLWVLISGSPTYDENGNISGSVGLHTNITNRKLMEQKLNSIANIPEENPNPTFRFSVHGQVLMYANPASQVAMEFFDNENNKEERKEWISLINQIYKKGDTVKKELSIKDRTYMCTIVPVTKNSYVNVYAVDITATKEAEAEIKKLSLVLSKTENAVIIADKEGKIKWVNEGFVQITGYSQDEVINTHGELLSRGKPTGLEKNHPYFIQMLQKKQSVSYESQNYKKNGQEYWTITTLTPLFDKDEELDSIIAIDTDITYKKRAEQEILKAKKIAEESAKAKELFLANMSHEIRTPMNAIMGIIQLLDDTPLDQTQMEYLKSMNFAGENLLRIINDVLDLSKIESGKMSLEKIHFDLNRLINDMLNSQKYRANEKGIKLIKYIGKNVPSNLIGDPVRLNQILINLISNAIKFTEKGHVKLSVHHVATNENNVRIKFRVQDTGIGIKKELHKLIFSDFEQANKETTRKYGGTGLGLAIVKRLLALQGGSIKVKSDDGKGSTFSIELPFILADETEDNYSNNDYIHRLSSDASRESKNKKNGSTGEERLLSDAKVLLVEDNALNQMVATKFLESMGLQVKLAKDGLECLNELARSEFDLVLMDIQMPKMDGYSAAKFIRSEMKSDKANIPIIAMTAHAISGEKDKCIACGMNDYISKPLKKDDLKNKIINQLKQSKNGNQ